MKSRASIISSFASVLFILGGLVAAPGCGSDSDSVGIAAQCSNNDDCPEELSCLTGFKGGYCGIKDCTADTDCPEDSVCVTHDDSVNYCFRACTDKAECNANRDVDNEANCSANITLVGTSNSKACVPPSQ